jgi:hypothetical protein
MHGKFFIVLCAVAACMLVVSVSGCGKSKQTQQAKSAVQTPQLAKESAADTSDIFKEFYSDDSSAKRGLGAKKASKQAEAAPRNPTSSSFSGEFSENGRYAVQVSCVKAQSYANSLVSKLKEKGFPAYVAEVRNPTPNLNGTFYRVRIGGFNAIDDAKSFGQSTLEPDGYAFWVDKKSNDNVGMEGYGLGSGGGAAGSYESAPSTYTPSSSFSGSSSSSFSTTPSSGSESFGSSSFGSSSGEASGSFSSSPSTSSSSSSGTETATGSSTSSASSSFSTEPSASGTSTTSPASSSSSFGSTSSSDTTASSGGTGSTGTTGSESTTGSGWGKDTSSSGW